jgi:hypothetical protein
VARLGDLEGDQGVEMRMIGDWVMFYLEGALVIGQVVALGESRSGDAVLYTTAGKVYAYEVLERRSKA